MRTSKIGLIVSLAIGAAVLAANSASAGGGFSFGGGNGGGGGVKFSFGGGHHGHHDHHGHHHHAHHYQNFYHYPVTRYVEPVLIYDHCYHPTFRSCFVYPGDTWLTICQRAYGCTYLWKHIASYNGLPISATLIPGQQLQLPVVNANGTLAASSAPAPAPFAPQGVPFGATSAQLGPQNLSVGSQGMPTGLSGGSPVSPGEAPANGPISTLTTQLSAPTTPSAEIRTLTNEPKRPTVAIGSVLMLEGESLGDEKGIVRLRISGMSLPVEVIEWTASAAKIQLPKMDLAGPMKAELEVVRADGSMASKTAIELTPAATRLALGN